MTVSAQEPSSPATPVQQAPQAEAPAAPSVETIIAENQKKLDVLNAMLKSQRQSLDQLTARLSRIEKEVGYTTFAQMKQAAITRAQDATFILNLVQRKVESTPTGTITYMTIGKTVSGTVVKDANGNIALLTAWKPLKEAQKTNPSLDLKLVLEPTAGKEPEDAKRLEASVALAQPAGGVKGYSEQFDLALLSLLADEADEVVQKRLKAVAMPLENYLGKSFQPGTEAVAIGRPFGFPRYVTQGIISDHDVDGTRKHDGVSKQFPKLWTDTGIANGSEGGPLLGFNWDKKQWDVMGIVSSGTNEVMNFAVPVDVVEAFLQRRGFEFVDPQDAKQVDAAARYDKLDQKTP